MWWTVELSQRLALSRLLDRVFSAPNPRVSGLLGVANGAALQKPTVSCRLLGRALSAGGLASWWADVLCVASISSVSLSLSLSLSHTPTQSCCAHMVTQAGVVPWKARVCGCPRVSKTLDFPFQPGLGLDGFAGGDA